MPLRNLLIIIVSAVISLACYEKAEHNRYAAVFSDAMQIIEGKSLERVEPRVLFEGAMDGMVGKLDEHSAFISPDDFRRFQESLDQEFGGVGIVVELNRETNRLTVMSPLVGTPAHKAGMLPGDMILEIDGTSTEGLGLEEAVELMRGKKGEPVDLLVRHIGDDEPVKFTIVRDIIQTPSVLGDVPRPDGSWEFYLEENRRVGYVRITTFGERTIEELKAALDYRDHSIDALIIDLRGNAGGLLKSAVEVSNIFIDEGTIVSTRGRDGVTQREYFAESDAMVDRDLPMVVLTNRFSASASEIVSACLQDHGRAVVVGERTWGKGTVQNVIELEGGKSALKLTTASYWRPSGKNIHRLKDASESDDWGVRPNDGFEVKLSDEEFEKVLRKRRDRDLAGLIKAAEDSSPNGHKGGNAVNGETPSDKELNGDEPFDDPQLRKAIEYLEQQINTKAAKALKA